jgi:methionyl-tRNA formyltransferase
MKIVIIGSGWVVLKQYHKLIDLGHEIVAILPDRSNQEFDWQRFTSVECIVEDNLLSINWDLGIMTEFGSLLKLPPEFSRNIINFHSGILPNFRGKSANLLAFLNSMPIGLSVHLVDSKMDSGRLIYQKSFNYNCHEQYELVASQIYDECISCLPDVIKKLDNRLFLESSSENVFYSIKFLPSDAVFLDYTFPLDFYKRMFLIFSNGTGVYIKFKNKKIKVETLEIQETSEFNLRCFLVGSVVNKEDKTHMISSAQGWLIMTLESELLIGSRLEGCKFFYNS